MKKYIAKTNVSINIVLSNGKNRHIAFNPLTGGGSVFYTDDPDIIDAMERHYKYGTLFRIDHKFIAEKQHNKPTPKPKPEPASQPTPVVSAPTPAPETVEEVQEVAPDAEETDESEQPDATDADSEPEAEDADNGLKKIVVSDPDAAKSYLAEHFGYSRTKIKTLKAIKEAAAANGIVFEGI